VTNFYGISGFWMMLNMCLYGSDSEIWTLSLFGLFCTM
jgi:hypothetical protein